MKKTLVFSTLSILILAGAAGAGQWATKYTYYGELSEVYDIPNTATVYYTGEGFRELKVGYAEAIEIIEKDPGPNLLRIKETHYNSDGSIIYEGYLDFSPGLNYCTIVGEKKIRGKKRNQMFDRWPCRR